MAVIRWCRGAVAPAIGTEGIGGQTPLSCRRALDQQPIRRTPRIDSVAAPHGTGACRLTTGHASKVSQRGSVEVAIRDRRPDALVDAAHAPQGVRPRPADGEIF